MTTTLPTPQPLIQATGLSKDFGHGKGIFGVDLSVDSGQVVGFVGPNGAGKSTTIGILTGFSRPDAGQFELLGRATDAHSIYRLMPRLGIMFAEQTADTGLTARRLFHRHEELLGRRCQAQWQRMSQLLELDVHKKIKHLSLGNKKKLAAICALMHEPELVIMDEPTSGLDPIIRGRLMELVAEVAARGGAVFLSSHDLGEVQQACHRIVMIKGGKVLLTDTTANILDGLGRRFRLIDPPEALLQKLQAAFAPKLLQRNISDVVVQVKDHAGLLRLLAAEDFANFYLERPSLDDAFRENYG